jgi:predicted RNA-binding Zn ribbon-like protein
MEAMGTFDGGRAATELLLAPHHALCLDFANTLCWRGSTRDESLHSLADVVQWCAASGAVLAGGVEAAMAWVRGNPAQSARVFNEAIAIREAIYRIFHAVAAGTKPANDDVAALNRALKRTLARVAVERNGAGFGWRVAAMRPTAPALLAAVLWSAGDLLTGPQLKRVRECANGQCLWLFLDDSKNGTRRWCSMQSCGNRAKAHRHYLRQKSG